MSTSEPAPRARATAEGPAQDERRHPAAGAGPAQPCLVDVAGLQAALARFAVERDWERFHSPKNLAMALAGEVGELLELFQWLSEEASRELARQPAGARRVRDELADVLLYLVRLADVLGVDLDEACRSKLAANAAKYPVERARGRADKYDAI